MRTPSFILLFSAFTLFLIAPSALLAQKPTVEQLLERLEAQEKRIADLEAKLAEMNSEQSAETTASSASQLKEQAPSLISATSKEATLASSGIAEPKTKAGYKKGFYISQKNEETDKSFALRINGRMQFRYTGFSRRGRSFSLANGASGTQPDTNDFEIERGRLEFRGHFFDPAMQFYLNLDFDTDDNHELIAHDFWFNYKFDDAFNLYAGKAFVPGSREWIDGSTTTHLIDRSMATSFFRPDRSLGLWAIGEVSPGLHYRAMLANGFKTTDLDRDEIDGNFTYAVSVWQDLYDNYGSGRADLAWHDEFALRYGASFTYSPIDDGDRGEPLSEADSVRLSNGIRLSDLGALAPGVLVDDFDILLYAADLGFKYQGWSMNSEFYYRSIENIEGSLGEQLASFEDLGLYVDLGYFIIPHSLEAVARYSYINGDLHDSYEYAGGVNYYLDGTHWNKLTVDLNFLEDSAVNSSGPNYIVGQNGLLYRVQWQIAF